LVCGIESDRIDAIVMNRIDGVVSPLL